MPLKISIVTVVRNRVGTIAQALDSVQSQTWRNVEHIVIDGASTDGTLALLESRRARLARLVSEPDGGIYDALNKGFALVTGDVVGLMHSDDFFADDQVLSSVAKAFEDPDVDAVYGDLDYVATGNTSQVIRRWRAGAYSARRLAWGWMPPHPTLFIRRRVINEWGGFDTRYRISADYDTVLRYFLKGGIRPVYIPRVLVKMRVGGESNKSLARIWRKSCEDYQALRRNAAGGILALVWKNLSKLKQFS